MTFRRFIISRIRRSPSTFLALFVLVIIIFILTTIFPRDDPDEEGSPDKNPYAHLKIVEDIDDPGNGNQVDKPRIDLTGSKYPIYKDGVLGNFEPQATESDQNRPGDHGKKFELSGEGIDWNEVNSKKNEYGMNLVASDHIPMDRVVPDLRHEECKYWHYPTELPTASVVIVFHNEGFSTLLRTVHTVLLRSPRKFLREVLLVDDFSDKESLKGQLDDYIMENFGAFENDWKPPKEDPFGFEKLHERSGKVRLVRNKERSGLIRSRARGATEAHGEVIVFLDAHCEVNINWLVPLLAPIAADPKTMTVPIIDGIDHDHFEYRPVYSRADQHFKGIWEWGMLYKEIEVDMHAHTKLHRVSEPYDAPTHAGGLFAISKKYFLDLGGYDPGLLVWGGENFELSFKVWQCGGRLLWVPCSRVGHIYRPFMPYSFGSLAGKRKGPLVLTNYKRVIEVWFDNEYKEYFYTREPLARYYEAGDISKQLEIKVFYKKCTLNFINVYNKYYLGKIQLQIF